jgi:hypothetical protein
MRFALFLKNNLIPILFIIKSVHTFMENKNEKPKIGFLGLLIIFTVGVTVVILISKFLIGLFS